MPVKVVTVVPFKFVIPEIYKLVDVTFVVVTLVNSALLAPAAPMAVFLIVPASMVSAFVTMASVMELAGRFNAPLT